MDKISAIFNFDNIGGKIKNLAKWSCWITILLIWFAAPLAFITLVADKRTAGLWWIPLVGAVVGPVSVWLGSWVMYAFGEFVEDIHALCNKEGTTEEANAKRDAEAKARRKAEEKEAAKLEAEQEQLSISDFEKTASVYLNRRISISEITCTLIYVIPKSTGKPKEMHLDMAVGDQEFTSLDLFFDKRRKAYYFKGRELALNGAWRSAEEIFSFDVALFKDFNTEVDEDD